MKNSWLSIHMFVWDYSLFDNLIEHISSELKKADINNFFFIRYWEGGPHMRFRFKDGESNRGRILGIFENTLRQTRINYPDIEKKELDKKVFYDETFTDGKELNYKKLPWFGNLVISEVPYVREIDRYGGKEFIEFAEDSFVESTVLTCTLLTQQLNLVAKLLVYYDFVSLITKELYGSLVKKQKLCEMASNFWEELGISPLTNINKLRRLRDISQQVDLNHMYDHFATSLKRDFQVIKVSKGEEYANSVMFSQFHMFANRLGLPISGELACYKLLEEGCGVN
ncbi:MULTISPECIES: lantibiotic dehydratase C-terminal domain-containing protein [Latilactobacillus]|uniref:Thiopeptide-type bacteriocin biosynthesis domain-containing protein n=1 Tax=Latilactobacillus curvatus TaxID=28038 RepID=A0ABN6GKX3_LATCU|nr:MULTISPECIES: lantibiotic dehydratase C-terminal domain-containing protein [Latilactobacillus]ASN13564.1 hypothetical protein B4V05_10045 [Latilactobacillus sakei]KGB13861.1 hypothetical protein KY41_10890 [Latilactobacillus sakei]UTB73231.1 hypothetical protein A4W72_10745 [Latilactobacillus curvatus]BCX31509.1 hypothetical protein LTWDN19_20760 [Latilactobacillus curvatus]